VFWITPFRQSKFVGDRKLLRDKAGRNINAGETDLRDCPLWSNRDMPLETIAQIVQDENAPSSRLMLNDIFGESSKKRSFG